MILHIYYFSTQLFVDTIIMKYDKGIKQNLTKD